MDIFLLILRLALAAVFGVAGAAKLFDRQGSEKAFSDFGVPAVLARPLAYIVPAIELMVAVTLLLTESSWFGSIGAAGLLTLFSGGMIYQFARGRAPDCHCFGQIHSAPVGVGSIFRNLGLLALALFLVLQGRSAQGASLGDMNQVIVQIVIGAVVAGLLVAILYFVRKLSLQQTELMRRIELMELVARDGGEVTRDDVGHPHEGLPIGALVPEFELASVGSGFVSLADIRAFAKPVLFLFVSPTCSPCQALVPEFEQWQEKLSGKVRFVFVSSGTAEDNLEKFGGDRSKQILLQKGREVAELVRAQWTPTAVLMDSSGRIASHVAAGDTAIRDLVAGLESRDMGQEFTVFTNGHGHSHGNRIGSDVPEFSAKDLRGNQIDADYFEGNRTLVAFWSPTCPYCLDMMDELREWDKTRGQDDPALLLFSDGEQADYEDIDLASPIILDERHKIAAEFGMYGTPSAVLVNEHGKIISETAVGAPDIWSLVGKRK